MTAKLFAVLKAALNLTQSVDLKENETLLPLIESVVMPYRMEWQTVAFTEAIEYLEFAAKGKSGQPRNCKKGYACGNGCISRTKTCRKKHTAKAKTAQQWLKSNSVEFENNIPRNFSKVPLFEEHVISVDKHITDKSLDDAWDAIQTQGAEERKALIREIINEQRIQAVFNDRKSSVRNKTEALYNALEFKNNVEDQISGAFVNQRMSLRLMGLGDNEINTRLSNDLQKIEQSVKRQYVGSIDARTNGYTRESGRHITILTDSSTTSRKGRGFEVLPESISDTTKDIFDNPASEWSVSSSYLTSAEREFKVYLHEMGHQIQYVAKDNKISTNPPLGAKQFTQYSRVNNSEYFAEHFALWVLDAETYRKADPIGHEFMNSVINNVKNKKRRIL